MSLITLHVHIYGSSDPEFRQQVLSKLEQIIMANEDIKAVLARTEAALDESNTRLANVAGDVDNLQAEIQTLKDIIAGMQNPDPELVALAERLEAKANALKAGLTAVDEDVPAA